MTHKDHLKTDANFSMTFSRISQICEVNIGVKASFRAIEAAMSVVRSVGVTFIFQLLTPFKALNNHNYRLKEDAERSLGINHVIYKTAAHYVEVLDKQVMNDMGISYSVLQSKEVKDRRKAQYDSSKLELLKWANIDPNVKTM